MAELIEQPIKTLFQGVSRQPHTVRLSGQTQEGINAIYSVVSGGFEKRMGTNLESVLTDLAVGDNLCCHSYERDSNESYWIIIKNGLLYVYDEAGNQKTVTYKDKAAAQTYLSNVSNPSLGFAFTHIVDTTLICNRSITSKMVPYYVKDDFKDVTNEASLTASPDNGTLEHATAEDTYWEYQTDAWVNVTSYAKDRVSYFGPAEDYNDLPRSGNKKASYLGDDTTKWSSTEPETADGAIWKVTGKGKKSYYYVQNERESPEIWNWQEIADPNIGNEIDPTTMPHRLDRKADGTFHFSAIEWNPRKAGDDIIVMEPDFVGHPLKDISFWNNRVVIAASETAYLGQAGDYFNMWPDEATEVLDSDPFGRVASLPTSNTLQYVVPVRKTLFVTSQGAQFEVTNGSGNVLKPSNAVIDPSTEYRIGLDCRPVVVGDELMFASNSGKLASVFEYYVDDDSVTNTATDASAHVRGYLKSPITKMVPETTTGMVFVQSNGYTQGLYIYSYYFDGEKKAQRAWSRWDFGSNVKVFACAILKGKLSMILSRNGKVTMESMDILVDNGPLDHPTPILLDTKMLLQGTYDAGANETTWTLPHAINEKLEGVLSTEFPDEEIGFTLNETPSGTSLKTTGNYSAGRVVWGVPFEKRVELSKQYLRLNNEQGEGPALTTGELILKNISFDFADTGYLEVHVTPLKRDTAVHKLHLTPHLGEAPELQDGTFKAAVNSDGTTVKIEIVNGSHLPSKITSASWLGEYNKVTG